MQLFYMIILEGMSPGGKWAVIGSYFKISNLQK